MESKTRSVALVLSLLLSAGLSACSGSSGGGAPGPTAPAPSTTDPAPSSSATDTASGSSSSSTAAATVTRHPVVLVHGFGGFRDIAGVEYFHRVPETLRAEGFEVLVTQTSPVNTILFRAQQLKDQIDAAYPDGKVNIIAHSMGGLDARALISTLDMGHRVASLTTISTPHRGTPVADVALGLLPSPVLNLLDLLIGVLGWDTGVLVDLSTDNMTQSFNPATPDDPRVFYQSYGGVADPLAFSNPQIDFLSPVFKVTWAINNLRAGENDGIVPLGSAKWGEWRGPIPADHGDQVGLVLGATSFDHLAFYKTIGAELAARGY